MQPDIPTFTVTIICSSCRAVGVMVWENQRGERTLVSISSGFHERLAKRAPHAIELVCDHCGAAQPEQS